MLKTGPDGRGRAPKLSCPFTPLFPFLMLFQKAPKCLCVARLENI